MNRAVFLDRDGVLNRAVINAGKPYPPASLADVEWLPGIGDAMTVLRSRGFRVIVVTNQPDVGKGVQRQETVEAIHAELRRRFPIDDIKVCYHTDEDGCPCRKPKPGLLLAAARQWDVDLSRSVMVGDRWRDIEAGRAAGCRTILLAADYDEHKAQRPDAVVQSLGEASVLICSGRLDHQPREVGV